MFREGNLDCPWVKAYLRNSPSNVVALFLRGRFEFSGQNVSWENKTVCCWQIQATDTMRGCYCEFLLTPAFLHSSEWRFNHGQKKKENEKSDLNLTKCRGKNWRYWGKTWTAAAKKTLMVLEGVVILINKSVEHRTKITEIFSLAHFFFCWLTFILANAV